MSLFKITRTSRPIIPTPLDYGNPIVDKLLVYSVYVDNYFRDYIHGVNFSNSGYYGNTIKSTPTKWGPLPTSTGYVELNYSVPVPRLTGPRYPYTSYSYEALTFFSMFVLKDTSIATTQNIQVLNTNTTSNFTATAWWRNDAGEKKLTVSYGYVDGSRSVEIFGISEGFHCLAITGKLNDTMKVYIDGIKVGESVTPVSNIYPQPTISNYPSSNVHLVTTGIGYYVGVAVARGVDEALIRSFTKNPWQIFQPITVNPQFDLIAPKVYVPKNYFTTRKSMMLGTSSPAVSQTAIATIRKTIRTKQPQGNYTLDPSHPLYPYLVAVLDASSGLDLVSGKQMTVVGSSSITPGVLGNAVTGNNSSLRYITLSQTLPNEMSIVGVINRFRRTGNTNLLLGLGNSASTAACYLQAATSVGSTKWGLAQTINSSATSLWYNINASSGTTIELSGIVLGATFVGSTATDGMRIYWNGISDGWNPISSSSGTNAGFNRFAIGGMSRSTNLFADTGNDVCLGLLFNIALSAEWHKSLSENPWQIFKPDQRIIGVST